MISSGGIVLDLPSVPVKAVRGDSPQALRYFNHFDQVNHLVGASEADANMGFMAWLMALCGVWATTT